MVPFLLVLLVPIVKVSANENSEQERMQHDRRRLVSFQLDFEGLTNGQQILGYYAPGGAGTDLGVDFSNATTAVASIDTAAGGTGAFSNEPSSDTACFFPATSFGYVNVEDGFEGFTFSYATTNFASVAVYTSTNGQGTALAGVLLEPTETTTPVSNWTSITVPFSGIASSILFRTPGFVYLDDFQFVQTLTILLDFEGLGDGDVLEGFYNGGLSASGLRGENYGVDFPTFTIGALIDTDSGGGALDFAFEPSPNAVGVVAARTVANVKGGFLTGVSFQYLTQVSATVTIYDGLDGTGNVLATGTVVAYGMNAGLGGDPTGSARSNWTEFELAFGGSVKAKSVVLDAGSFPMFLMDDWVFGALDPPT